MIEVLSPGTFTTVQDWPGRVGFWEVGVPPSGPMDARSLRIANRLVGNPQGAAGMEATLSGPRLRFARAATVAVTGAPLAAKVDGVEVRRWRAIDIPAGGELALGVIRGAGMRAYVAVRGGLNGRLVMGSRSVFVAGRLAGDVLRRGDMLGVGPPPAQSDGVTSRSEREPPTGNDVELRVVPGPHGAPEFLTAAGLDELFGATWTVHHHSDRTGVRLVGPRPQWSRADGGVAGLHPSNILDSAYSVGTVMLAGDMAVIVGPDGPSLGGFVAIAQVIRADLALLGQLRAGDRVRLHAVDERDACAFFATTEAQIEGREVLALAVHQAVYGLRRMRRPAPVFDRPLERDHGTVTYRRAGECAVLVEFGDPALDLRSRVRAHLLHQRLAAERPGGIGEITPGVRSLHIQYEPERIDGAVLIDALMNLEASAGSPDELTISARAVRLPLAWRHSQAQLAVERYQSSVWHEAPWCPDNVEFIRRVNDLPDERAVREIVCAARYLVLGLGDVYLGAPVAVPLDPRHRLVTTKYAPARTWTPANAVGIGGTFLCVYGVEGPGGYQLVGRTVPIWCETAEPPHLLRHFDQLRFELVDEQELEELRELSSRGAWEPRTEPAEFSLAAHQAFLGRHAEEIERFTARREAAFAAEREAWRRGPGRAPERSEPRTKVAA
jgi:urea carboxylase